MSREDSGFSRKSSFLSFFSFSLSFSTPFCLRKEGRTRAIAKKILFSLVETTRESLLWGDEEKTFLMKIIFHLWGSGVGELKKLLEWMNWYNSARGQRENVMRSEICSAIWKVQQRQSLLFCLDAISSSSFSVNFSSLFSYQTSETFPTLISDFFALRLCDSIIF